MPNFNILPTDKAIIEIQEGLSGANNWKALALIGDTATVRLGAIDTKELDVVRYPGRNQRNGRLQVVASGRTGEVPTFTSEIQIMDTGVAAVINSLNGKNNIRVRYFQGEYSDPTNYRKLRVLSRAWNTKPGGGQFSRDMENSFEGFQAQKDPQLRTFPLNIDAFLEIDPIVRSNISASVTTLAIKDIVSLGYARWAGEVTGENTNNLGDTEYAFITAKSGAGAGGKVFYTADKGATWSNTSTPNDFDGTGITRAGKYVIISASDATGGGLAYAPVADVRAGTATWTRSTGISAGTLIRHVRRVNDNIVLAVGPSGAMYISLNSGVTFASAGSAVTANNLNWIAAAGDDLQWFGGATQTLVRRYKDVASVITVTGLTGTINCLAVPPGAERGTEIFVACSDGSIRKSLNGTATTPTWSVVRQDSAVSSVDAIAFGGPNGEIMYAVETNGSSQSRVIRDYSGGFGGSDVEVLSSFTIPSNSSIDAICVPDDNYNIVMGIGPVSGGQGYIERIA